MGGSWERLYRIYELIPQALRAPARPFISSVQTLRWFVLYLAIGVGGVALYLIILWCMLRLGLNPLAATALACVLSASAQFLANRNRNFRAFDRPIAHQATNYAAIGIAMFFLTMVLVWLGINTIGLPPFTANALTLLITAPLAYLANRHTTFGPGIAARMRFPAAEALKKAWLIWQRQGIAALVRRVASMRPRSTNAAVMDGQTAPTQDQRTMLVVDTAIPFMDRSAGARRLFAAMKVMLSLGWHVVFVAEDGAGYEPFTTMLRTLGIDVRVHRDSAAREISRLSYPFDAAWISRPELMATCAKVVRERCKAAIIYDTVDLHYRRLQREGEITGTDSQWEEMRDLELAQMKAADVVISTSSTDRDALAQLGIAATVVPIIEELVEPKALWNKRTDVLFLGNYSHEPNVDAAEFLVHQIMPLVWKDMPRTRVVLAGAEPTRRVQRLKGTNVLVPGFIEDIGQVFESALVLAAPIRYGAGMKGKIIESLAHGVPVVTTAIGAEGIGIDDGVNGIVTEDPATFAAEILRLQRDQEHWESLSRASLQLAACYTPAAVAPEIERILTLASLRV